MPAATTSEFDPRSSTTSMTYPLQTAQPAHEASGAKAGVLDQIRPSAPHVSFPAPVRRAIPVALSMKTRPIVESSEVVVAMLVYAASLSPRSHCTDTFAQLGS